MNSKEQQLITAVKDGDIEKVRTLIEKGVNINVFYSGRTPLGIAAHQGNVSMLELLLNCGEFKQSGEKKLEIKPEKLDNKLENKPENKKLKKERKKTKKSDSRRDVPLRSAMKKRKAVQGNNGYYEVIHDDKSDDSEPEIHKRVPFEDDESEVSKRVSFEDDDSEVSKRVSFEDDEPEVSKRVSFDDVETPEGMDKLEWDVELSTDEDSESNDAWSDQYRWYAKILANSCHVASQVYKGCDVNLQDSVGRCALHYAAENGHVNAVKLLLNACSKPDVGDVDSVTPLHLAAKEGHLAVVETLLVSGCLVNDYKTTDKLSPLHYAAAKGHTQIVNVLLNSGAHIDSLDENERTPLMLAVSRNLKGVAEVLIKRGAKVNIEDVKGYTALSEAVWGKSFPLVKMLLSAGAKIVPTHFLVHYAVLHRQLDIARVLLEAGALVNIRDMSGDTPLIVAAVSAQPEMMKLLISHGATVDGLGGSPEKTPLFYSIMTSDHECTEVIKILVESGADIDRITWEQTPLACALNVGKKRIAVTLIALGAKLMCCYNRLILGCDSIPVTKAFGFAGYDYRNYLPEIKPSCSGEIKTGTDWLRHIKCNPLSLAELSRIAVRAQAPSGRPLSLWISSLEIPTILKRYLMLEDILETLEI